MRLTVAVNNLQDQVKFVRHLSRIVEAFQDQVKTGVFQDVIIMDRPHVLELVHDWAQANEYVFDGFASDNTVAAVRLP